MVSPSIALRIAGGFIVLLAGSAGVWLPFKVASAHDSSNARGLLRTKAFSAGVVLALALIHLLGDAWSAFRTIDDGALREGGLRRHTSTGRRLHRRARRLERSARGRARTRRLAAMRAPPGTL